MELLVVVIVVLAVVAQLERTDRRRRRQPAAPYLHPLDRDARRVADEVAAARERHHRVSALPHVGAGVQEQWSRHA